MAKPAETDPGQKNGDGGGGQGNPIDFEVWLSEQPEEIQAAYADHTTGLTNTVKTLRTENKQYRQDAQARQEAAKAEERTRLEAEGNYQEALERVQAESESWKAKYESAVQAQLRTSVALSEGLPAEMAGRLQGETEDEMRADAQSLKAFLKEPDQSGGGVPPTPKGQQRKQDPKERRAQAFTPRF